MKLNEAVSQRIQELLNQQGMTQYQLFTKSGVPKSTISHLIHCSYDSVKLRIIHELCQGFGISVIDFFNPPFLKKSIWTHKKCPAYPVSRVRRAFCRP